MFLKKSLSLTITIIYLFFINLQANLHSLQPLLDTLINLAEDHKQDPLKTIPLVAIGGCPGVGKTYLTKNLVEKLQERGVNCIALHLDHFNLSLEERKKIGTEWDIRHFKSQELHSCLSSIFLGEKCIPKPTYDQLTGETGIEVLTLNHIDLILFDGLYALCSQTPLNFLDYCSLGIFLEAEEADVRAWKWEREQKKTQPRTFEEFVNHMDAMLSEYHHRIKYSKKDADFIIKKDHNHCYELKVPTWKLN